MTTRDCVSATPLVGTDEMVAEIVRQFPIELDDRHLLDLCFVAAAGFAARHHAPLLDASFVRTAAGIDASAIRRAMQVAAEDGRIRAVTLPSYHDGARFVVRPGHAARAARQWQARAWAAYVAHRFAALPASRLHARILACAAVASASRGGVLDLARATGL